VIKVEKDCLGGKSFFQLILMQQFNANYLVSSQIG